MLGWSMVAALGAMGEAQAAPWHPQQESVPVLEQAIQAMENGQHETSERSLKRLLKSDPCGFCQLTMANVVLAQNRPLDAMAILTALKEDHDDQEHVWTLMGQTHFTLQNWDRAKECAQTALKLEDEGGHLNALQLLLWVSLRTGDYDTLLKPLAARRRASPRSAYACLELEVRADQGDKERVEELFEQCRSAEESAFVENATARRAQLLGEKAKLDAGDSWRTGQLEQAAEAFNRQDWESAAKIYRTVLKREPENLVARLNLGVCLRAQGLLEEAAKELARVFEGETWITVDGGRYTGILTKQAERDWLDLRSQAGGMYVGVLVELGRVDDAVRHLKRFDDVLEPGPHLARAQMDVLVGQGRIEDAWDTVRVSLKSWPDATPVAQGAWAVAWAAPEKADVALLKQLPSTRGEDLVNLALVARDFETCVDRAAAALPKASRTERGKIAALGVSCAAMVDDVEQGEAFLKDADPNEVTDAARYNLALAHLKAEDPEAALARLPEEGSDEELNTAVAGIRLSALRALERWPEALKQAAHPSISPDRRASLAAALLTANTLQADALRLLEQACPQIEDPAIAESCKHNLDLAKKRSK